MLWLCVREKKKKKVYFSITHSSHHLPPPPISTVPLQRDTVIQDCFSFATLSNAAHDFPTNGPPYSAQSTIDFANAHDRPLQQHEHPHAARCLRCPCARHTAAVVAGGDGGGVGGDVGGCVRSGAGAPDFPHRPVLRAPRAHTRTLERGPRMPPLFS